MIIKKFSILISLLLLMLFGFSQEEWEFSNSTPRETVKSHLYFLEKQHYDPVLSSYTLMGNLPENKKVRLIKQLKAILLKHKINVEEISDKRKSFFNGGKYILFEDMPEIYLERDSQKWLYSEETVNSIEDIYNKYVIKRTQKVAFKEDLKNAFSKQLNTSKNEITIIDSTNINPQNEIVQPELNLSTPYNTIVSHLFFLEDSIYRPGLSAQTINFSLSDSSRIEELSVKLKQIYLGSSHEIFNLKKLSTDSNYIDSTSGRHFYFPNLKYPELFLEKIGDTWMYSNSTSKLINSVHQNIYSEDAEQIFKFSDRFKKWAGSETQTFFYDVKLWQIFMLLYFVIIGFVILLVNHFIIRRFVFFILKNNKYKKLIYKIYHVVVFIVFYHILELYIPALEMDMSVMHVIHKVVRILIIFNTTVLSFYIVNILKIRFAKEDIPVSQQGLLVFIALILKVIIFTTSLLFIISALDFNLVNVLAGLSIGGFALALGAQDTIKNFFGSLMIFADHPFSVGDYISNDKVTGTVEEVGLRTTKIRTFHNSVVTVPNSKLADDNIDNLGRRRYRRFNAKIIIDFDTPTDKIDAFVEKIREEIKNHPDTRKDFYLVSLNNFSTYGLEILLYVFFEVPEWSMEMTAKHQLMSKVLDFAKESGIKFAIPPR